MNPGSSLFFMFYLQITGKFEWRDPDSNRGHHDFQLPSLRSNPFYCVHQIRLFAGFLRVCEEGLSDTY